MRSMGKFVLGTLVVLGLATPVMAHSGHTVWGGWTFDWEVKDNAGIALRNVYFNNELVFYKASLPVIRVRYDHSCGPYQDRINWDKLVKISNCGNKKVCQKSYSSGGRNWLEVGVYARIGAYHIYQAWYLSHDGWIGPTMWSKGLQCNVDHDHHPYWRMDFDINGFTSDQVFVYDNNRPNEGWGPGWHKYPQEINDVKNPGTDRVWFARDNPTEHGVWVIPGPDGAADSFSNKDAGVRRYHYAEDQPWPFGAWGHLGYLNGEDVQEKDIILWYVAHLHHEAAEGSDQWHWVGPWLLVHR